MDGAIQLSDLDRFDERLIHVSEAIDKVLTQTKLTNGRVTQLELQRRDAQVRDKERSKILRWAVMGALGIGLALDLNWVVELVKAFL